ncbi:MAG: Asp-tRNA(Asn)/Glu-tRNA(Gln) amidotransferase subunit GatC [Chloroflexi bacterium]|nr:Asp-tRNA(Asn)/Glu-tRNA(Gln) amidotransferase subunit GatC [Chloroflexota bacterium]
MALTADEVRYIARLARVALTGDEVERMREQLSNILDHFQALNDVPTDDVPPTAQSLDLANVDRPDQTHPPADREQVLANAPRRENGFLRVRAVLEA